MIDLLVKDMTCNHCVAAVARTVKAVDPRATVDVDLATKRVRIESERPLAELTAALARAGYPASA